MNPPRTVDVIIAGEGVAGASAAAALAEFGWEVLVVEPGLDAAKRLAGELIHPPGATDLAALRLLADLEATGGAPVLGFAVFDDPTMAAPHLLPYAPGPGLRPRGFAMEHSTMAATLRRAVGRLPHVRVWHGARVVALDNSRDDAVTVVVSSDGLETPLRARLLVGADGATSAIRRLAGIGQERWRISRMRGYLLPGGRLPMPGYGTVFLGGPALALAYQVSDAAVRVMFDVRDADEVRAPVRDESYLEAFPEPFRTDVRRAMADQRGLVSTNYSVLPERVAQRRIVLVGDAAGCCHPLTATGLSVCTRDALRLRDALRATGGSVGEALRQYAAGREEPQRTRLALAETLYNIFVGRTAEMRLIRAGLLRYWKSSARGRAASMALLSTQEGRMAVMAREYARVAAYTMPGLLARPGAREEYSLVRRGRAALALWQQALRLTRQAFWRRPA
jgi:2-polyprenyl-6-methoxyphenol hydroxylase-like FAD-dependent oxidoreductase